jgi:HPt (histidine-containing phosphotransfer) domain-containing protein
MRPQADDIARLYARKEEAQYWIEQMTNELDRRTFEEGLDAYYLRVQRHQNVDARAEDAFDELVEAINDFLLIDRPTDIDIARINERIGEASFWINQISNNLIRREWQEKLTDEVLRFQRHLEDPQARLALDDVYAALHLRTQWNTNLAHISAIRWAIEDAEELIAQVANPVQRRDLERELEGFKVQLARLLVNIAIREYNSFVPNGPPNPMQGFNILLLVQNAQVSVDELNSIDSGIIAANLSFMLADIARLVRWDNYNNAIPNFV